METHKRPKFKVVNKKDNSSCMVSNPICFSIYEPREKTNKYKRIYKKGSIIKAEKDTLGLMVFKTKKRAEAWLSYTLRHDVSIQVKIIKVLPIGKGKTPKAICSRMIRSHHLSEFYQKNNCLTHPPSGTICYQAVKVIGG